MQNTHKPDTYRTITDTQTALDIPNFFRYLQASKRKPKHTSQPPIGCVSTTRQNPKVKTKPAVITSARPLRLPTPPPPVVVWNHDSNSQTDDDNNNNNNNNHNGNNESQGMDRSHGLIDLGWFHSNDMVAEYDYYYYYHTRISISTA